MYFVEVFFYLQFVDGNNQVHEIRLDNLHAKTKIHAFSYLLDDGRGVKRCMKESWEEKKKKDRINKRS